MVIRIPAAGGIKTNSRPANETISHCLIPYGNLANGLVTFLCGVISCLSKPVTPKTKTAEVSETGCSRTIIKQDVRQHKHTKSHCSDTSKNNLHCIALSIVPVAPCGLVLGGEKDFFCVKFFGVKFNNGGVVGLLICPSHACMGAMHMYVV